MIAAARAANRSSRAQPSVPRAASASRDSASRADRPCNSAAFTVSPAPMVSTTSTFSPGTEHSPPSRVYTVRPSPPRVTTTADGPSASHSRGVPPNHAASSADTFSSVTEGSQLAKRAR
ncbi:hypothetical protein GA0115256_135942 [Streptomyces sp. DconLS]|nr:hypothetical protein GA0115256_135942 [Streptomyces sp. DconLS]